MRRISLAPVALVLAGGLPGVAFAAEAVVTISCANPHVPTLSAVGAATGIDNASAAYAARETLLHRAQRLCKDPTVAQVRFVPDTNVSVEPLRTVARR